jgi:hypothetical protein
MYFIRIETPDGKAIRKVAIGQVGNALPSVGDVAASHSPAE